MTDFPDDGSDRDRRIDDLTDCFDDQYASYQYVVVEFLLEHLTDLDRAFGGDFAQVLLLALIGQMRLREIHKAGGHPDEIAHDQMSITASQLADMSGIPPETVRLKLALLRDRGWIGQASDGSWSIVTDRSGAVSPAKRDLAALDHRSRRRVARLVAALEALADRPGA